MCLLVLRQAGTALRPADPLSSGHGRAAGRSFVRRARPSGRPILCQAGSEEISPTAARDDGRFIFLTFSNNRDMPAIYSVDDEGNEALINTSVIDGNTIVIQRMVPRLMLRKGKAVASVINKSFDMNGGTDNKTGTVAKDVQRVIKGAQ